LQPGFLKSFLNVSLPVSDLIREDGDLDPAGEEVVSLKPVLTNPVFI
jgi:hypothetical protein